MMKTFLWMCCIFFSLPIVVSGQESTTPTTIEMPVDSLQLVDVDTVNTALSVPLTLPLFEMPAPGFDGCSPWYMGTYGTMWNLHEGLNAQLGMSISTALGKHAPSGVGFGQSANLAYALPLGKRFSFAGGVYVQNMDWGNFHQRDAGISAILGYRVNDIVSLYAYGTKSFIPQHHQRNVMLSPYFLDNFRDRIGAMAEFKIGENAKISVSVERSSSNVSPVLVPDFSGGTSVDNGNWLP